MTRYRTLIMSCLMAALMAAQAHSQDAGKPAKAEVDASKLKVSSLQVPAEGSSQELMDFIRTAQKVQPTTRKEYLELNLINLLTLILVNLRLRSLFHVNQV